MPVAVCININCCHFLFCSVTIFCYLFHYFLFHYFQFLQFHYFLLSVSLFHCEGGESPVAVCINIHAVTFCFIVSLFSVICLLFHYFLFSVFCFTIFFYLFSVSLHTREENCPWQYPCIKIHAAVKKRLKNLGAILFTTRVHCFCQQFRA